MPADPRLMALPALRDYAESEERDFYSLDVSIRGTSLGRWERMDREVKHICVTARLTLLSDLSRPASRDAVARLVAEAVGLECGATAPDIGRFVCGEHCCDGDLGRMVPCARPIWSMMGADETQMVVFADCPDPDAWDGDERRHVPGISAVTDSAGALALIALTVLGTTVTQEPPNAGERP